MGDIVYLLGKQVKAEYIRQALNLDRLVYEDIFYLEEDQCIKYYKKNPYIYIIALDKSENKVVGYINFSPIKKNTYEKMKQGQAIDVMITENDIEQYRDNKSYWAYFSSIVVHPNKRHLGIAKTMICELKKMLEELSKRNIHFQGIIADVVSDAGEKIVIDFGLEEVCRSNHNSKIMEWKEVRV